MTPDEQQQPQQQQGVDVNAVIQHLAARIADLEIQIAVLKATTTTPPKTA